MKTCTKCKETKPVDDFNNHPTGKDGKTSKCRSCQHSAQKDWRENNKERHRTYQRFYRTLEKYGIDQQAYNAMLADQNNVCKICKQPETLAHRVDLCVDHCHATGKVRGLLCDSCNNLLGRAKDSVEILKNAIQYLEQ